MVAVGRTPESTPTTTPTHTSFVIKKKGLIASTAKHGNVVGEGHAYLKSVMWWTGMILMIIGEVSIAFHTGAR